MICAKIGPFTNSQRPAAVLFVEDLGAGDVRRHQIRRELNALEAEIENLGDRLDEQRLCQPGYARQQAVAAGEERDEHLLDDFVLSDDDFAQLAQDPFAAFLDFGGNAAQLLERPSDKFH